MCEDLTLKRPSPRLVGQAAAEQARGRRRRNQFVIYEPVEFVDGDRDEHYVTEWVETGMAYDLPTAERFINKIKNAVVRDLNSDNIVIVKKEN